MGTVIFMSFNGPARRDGPSSPPQAYLSARLPIAEACNQSAREQERIEGEKLQSQEAITTRVNKRKLNAFTSFTILPAGYYSSSIRAAPSGY